MDSRSRQATPNRYEPKSGQAVWGRGVALTRGDSLGRSATRLPAWPSLRSGPPRTS